MDDVARIKNIYQGRIEKGLIERYSLFRPGELYMLQRREEETLRLLRRQGLAELRERRILEIGCGRGTRLLDWIRWGMGPDTLVGVDIMAPFINEARNNLPRAHFAVASGNRLPFRDSEFDIVVQSTVFSSILDPALRHAVADEMVRVTSRQGAILWYDFRYPSPGNPDVRPVAAAEIAALFPGRTVTSHSLTLLPPLARRLAPVSVFACRALEKMFPPLRSHLLAVIRE
jgi:ubiquinone/menaquinone biosynthesis C-methylase UbiE